MSEEPIELGEWRFPAQGEGLHWDHPEPELFWHLTPAEKSKEKEGRSNLHIDLLKVPILWALTVHAHLCVCMRGCVCACVHVGACACVYKCVCVCTCTCVYVCVHMWACVCVCICAAEALNGRQSRFPRVLSQMTLDLPTHLWEMCVTPRLLQSHRASPLQVHQVHHRLCGCHTGIFLDHVTWTLDHSSTRNAWAGCLQSQN